MNLTARQITVLIRSWEDHRERIVVGRLGISHAFAERFVALGLWEPSTVEHIGLTPHQRYRVTMAGQSLAAEKKLGRLLCR